jgi:hypothetical protein
MRASFDRVSAARKMIPLRAELADDEPVAKERRVVAHMALEVFGAFGIVEGKVADRDLGLLTILLVKPT